MAGADSCVHAFGMTRRAVMLKACLRHDRRRNALRALKDDPTNICSDAGR
jgi:hypothetical protein